MHPDLGKLDVTVTEFGEIADSMDIDKINKFLDKNVEDKKLNNLNPINPTLHRNSIKGEIKGLKP